MSHALRTKVEELVKTNPVIVFMKGTADFPACGFSARAVQVLRAAGVKEIHSVNLLEDEPLWDALEEVTQWPTSPQVFVHGKFLGGSDIVTEMYERGELQELLKTR